MAREDLDWLREQRDGAGGEDVRTWLSETVRSRGDEGTALSMSPTELANTAYLLQQAQEAASGDVSGVDLDHAQSLSDQAAAALDLAHALGLGGSSDTEVMRDDLYAAMTRPGHDAATVVLERAVLELQTAAQQAAALDALPVADGLDPEEVYVWCAVKGVTPGDHEMDLVRSGVEELARGVGERYIHRSQAARQAQDWADQVREAWFDAGVTPGDPGARDAMRSVLGTSRTPDELRASAELTARMVNASASTEVKDVVDLVRTVRQRATALYGPMGPAPSPRAAQPLDDKTLSSVYALDPLGDVAGELGTPSEGVAGIIGWGLNAAVTVNATIQRRAREIAEERGRASAGLMTGAHAGDEIDAVRARWDDARDDLADYARVAVGSGATLSEDALHALDSIDEDGRVSSRLGLDVAQTEARLMRSRLQRAREAGGVDFTRDRVEGVAQADLPVRSRYRADAPQRRKHVDYTVARDERVRVGDRSVDVTSEDLGDRVETVVENTAPRVDVDKSSGRGPAPTDSNDEVVLRNQVQGPEHTGADLSLE